MQAAEEKQRQAQSSLSLSTTLKTHRSLFPSIHEARISRPSKHQTFHHESQKRRTNRPFHRRREKR